MHEGKRAKFGFPKHIKRSLALMAFMVIILGAGIGGTMAWLTDNTSDVENTFQPGTVPPSIHEDFKGEVKKNVSVTNDGNVDAYIRAAIVVTWQKAATDEAGSLLYDENGNLIASGEIASEVPVLGTDYSMELALDGWSDDRLTIDGFYYYKTPVKAEDDPSTTGIKEDTTGYLISDARQLKEKDGYKLVIEILAQSIQADGLTSDNKKPVVDAWGVDPETLS